MLMLIGIPPFSAKEFAVTMTPGATTLTKIIQCSFDLAIEELLSGLDSMARPVFLRIGQEFNGVWNGYCAPEYVLVWRRIATAPSRRSALRSRTALVWDYTCDDHSALDATAYQPYYPGDDVVDWWAVNTCSGPLHDPLTGVPSSMPSSTCVHRFVQVAASRGYPVMLAEAQPRYIGAQSAQQSWPEWFAPFFSLLGLPAVKAFPMSTAIARTCQPTSTGAMRGSRPASSGRATKRRSRANASSTRPTCPQPARRCGARARTMTLMPSPGFTRRQEPAVC